MDLGIVIPVHADTASLARVLERISAFIAAPNEIVIVSSAADERIRRLAKRHSANLLAGPANRGAQLDIGARACRAPVLWFLHASAEPDPGSPGRIADVIEAGAESGCFRFAFSGSPAPIKRAIAGLANLRVALGGVAYGDQGLFAQADVYAACGGFAHTPLFEEVSLVRALRRRGTFRVLEVPLRVSPRRFERDGWIRRSVHNRWLAFCYMVGVPAERLARDYRKAPPAESRR